MCFIVCTRKISRYLEEEYNKESEEQKFRVSNGGKFFNQLETKIQK